MNNQNHETKGFGLNVVETSCSHDIKGCLDQYRTISILSEPKLWTVQS